jgi:2-hydroxychromene-2-carboxylate isomerase
VSGQGPRFYFDLGSPLGYLAAEQVLPTLGPSVDWLPVQGHALPRSANQEAFRCEHEFDAFKEDVAVAASRLGLPEVRWPDPFPFDSAQAMLVASYAKTISKGIVFALAAFRQAFAGGHGLHNLDHVMIAAAACEMHPRAVAQALTSPAPARALRQTAAMASDDGVATLPAVVVGSEVFEGISCVTDAASTAVAPHGILGAKAPGPPGAAGGRG